MTEKPREYFYDRVARKHGGYGYGDRPEYTSVYPEGVPEQVFFDRLTALADPEKVALDSGCADGKFTLTVAPLFKTVIGIDLSQVNLEIAQHHCDDPRSRNVQFALQDAGRMAFPNAVFDVIYARRGPDCYDEYFRILKPGGHYVEIAIGEEDVMELKKVFGRGQGYGKWGTSILNETLTTTDSIGYKRVFGRDYRYKEYYTDYHQLELLLSGVPIFEDFDPEADQAALQEYAARFTTPKGIEVARHRMVMVVQKGL